MKLPNTTRREFLENIVAGAVGLVGFVNAESDAQTKNNFSFQDNPSFQIDPQNPENQPDNTIDASQFPEKHVYYVSPKLQPNQNPKLADKSDLEKATPSMRKIEQKKYNSDDGEYWVLIEMAQKEIYEAIKTVSEAEGISFVGERNYFRQLWEARPENAKIPGQKRETYFNLLLSRCDVTPLIFSYLESQPIIEEKLEHNLNK